MLPTLLVVGAQRCGTTSMVKALSQHPSVLPLWYKGVHYFDVQYDRGMPWYQSHFPLNATASLVRRRTGREPVTLESAPYYMFHPLAGERIARDLPGVRLLVLVRDPVERAYSAHAHETARGFETEPFEKALQLERQRTDGEAERLAADPTAGSFSHQHHSYVARGQYADQIERLVALVGRERVHVVDSQDMFTEPVPVFDGVTDFLRLPRSRDIRFEQHNARPRQTSMAPEVRSRLEAHFEPYDRRLEAWLPRPPSWRR